MVGTCTDVCVRSPDRRSISKIPFWHAPWYDVQSCHPLDAAAPALQVPSRSMAGGAPRLPRRQSPSPARCSRGASPEEQAVPGLRAGPQHPRVLAVPGVIRWMAVLPDRGLGDAGLWEHGAASFGRVPADGVRRTDSGAWARSPRQASFAGTPSQQAEASPRAAIPQRHTQGRSQPMSPSQPLVSALRSAHTLT